MNNFVKGFWLVLEDVSSIMKWVGVMMSGSVIMALVAALIAGFFTVVS